MKKIIKHLLLFSLIAGLFGCKTPFQPRVTNSPNSYLVVEGVINNNNGSTDSTIIKLSRTANISASDKPMPELRAQVFIEDGQSFSFALHYAGNGNYVAGPLGIDSTKKYRLRIKTNDNKTYLSDFCTHVYTPPVDSIGISAYENAQIIVYANAHNSKNNTRYYRWDFSETWEIRPSNESDYMTNGVRIVPRVQLFPDRCWNSDASTDIVIASSAKLANDVIYQAPITYIKFNSEKIGVRYSILLKQYGLTQDAFTFWSQLKKNTEQLGSIFDAQPSQINGNIHCTSDPTEPVFGYVSITNIQSKRVFINRSSIPTNAISDFLAGCLAGTKSIYYLDTTTFVPSFNTVSALLIPLSSDLLPINKTADSFIDYIHYKQPLRVLDSGYISAPSPCLDCSLRGTTKAPSFWKEN